MSIRNTYSTKKSGVILHTGTATKIDTLFYKEQTFSLLSLDEKSIFKRAKEIAKLTEIKHLLVLEYIAFEIGYKSWKQVRAIRAKGMNFSHSVRDIHDVYNLIPPTEFKKLRNSVFNFLDRKRNEINALMLLADEEKKPRLKRERKRLSSQINKLLFLITGTDPKLLSKQRCECGRFLTWKEQKHMKKQNRKKCKICEQKML